MQGTPVGMREVREVLRLRALGMRCEDPTSEAGSH
jgi:hypothetical protein